MSIATYDLASLTYDSATTDYDGGGLGLSNMPVVGVFISFTDGPYVVDPNWVEVTQYVRDINVRRGRGNDLQQFPSGSANLTLDNRTRLFDPFNAAEVQRTNLVANPSFELGISTWTTSGTVARTTAEFFIGVASASLTYAGSGTVLIQQSTRSPVTAGLAYTASFYLKQSVDAGSVVCNFMWYNSVGTIILDDTHQSNNPNTAWQRFSQTRTAPTNAVSCSLRIYQTSGEGGGAVATVNYVDAVLFEQSSTVNDYFDGSTLPNGAVGVGITSWTGTANASTSTLVNFPNGNYLKPRRQIKIVGQWQGVTYPIFRGFIAGWPVGYSDGGKDSTVELDCFDALGLLAAETTDPDPLFTYTMTLSPYHYYRFDETIVPATSPTITFKDYGSNAYSFTLTGTRIGNAESLAKGIKSSSLDTSKEQLISTAPTRINRDASNYFTNWSQSYWVEYSTVLGTNLIISQDNFGNQYLVQINSSGYMTVLIYAGGSVGWLWTTNAIVQQGTNATHIAITYVDNALSQGTLLLYINGVQVAVTSSVVGGPAFPLVTFDTINMSASKLQEYVRFTYVLTADQVLNIYKNGIALFNETTAARFTRLLANTSFPALMQSVTDSPVASVTESNNGQQLINELNVIQDSEGGELYASSQGILTFVNRDYLASTRSATSNMTFTDTGTGVYYDYASLRMAYDADSVRNEFAVSYTGSGQVLSSDATSTSSFGSSGESLSTYIDSATNAKTLADRSVTLYKNPKLRIEPFVVKGQRNPTYDWPRLLALELLDRFTFVRTPSTGSAISQDMLLQSIEHRITPGTWETVVNGSARYTGWFIIGTSLIGGTDVLL